MIHRWDERIVDRVRTEGKHGERPVVITQFKCIVCGLEVPPGTVPLPWWTEKNSDQCLSPESAALLAEGMDDVRAGRVRIMDPDELL